MYSVSELSLHVLATTTIGIAQSNRQPQPATGYRGEGGVGVIAEHLSLPGELDISQGLSSTTMSIAMQKTAPTTMSAWTRVSRCERSFT